MKLGKEDIAAIVEIVGEAESLRPVVKEFVKAVKSFAPELDELVGGLLTWGVKKRIESIRLYEKEGFTREEAIYLTMDTWYAIKNNLNRNNPKKEK